MIDSILKQSKLRGILNTRLDSQKVELERIYASKTACESRVSRSIQRLRLSVEKSLRMLMLLIGHKVERVQKLLLLGCSDKRWI